MRHVRALLSIAACALGLVPAGPMRASTCEEAARAAEIRHGLPSGLLTAIGRVESGGAGGWNWSVNPNDGTPSQRFGSSDAVENYVQNLLSSGRRLLDLGCFQIDLSYHPEAFARWQDAFDTDMNAEASARILLQLHARLTDWNQVIALYHSADPARGQSYLRSVLGSWKGAHLGVDDAIRPIMSSLQADPYVVLSSTSASDIAVWMPDCSGCGRAVRRRKAHGTGLPHVITP